MRKYGLIFLASLLLGCSNSGNIEGNTAGEVNTSLIQEDLILELDSSQVIRRYSILVLPPFDEIANAGISPRVQNYLEREISKDSSVVLIEFPFIELMNTPYQNVFDKKYCQPILNKVEADIIIMTKLDQVEWKDGMDSSRWNFSIRIYNHRTDKQFDSKVAGYNLTSNEIEILLSLKVRDLINEVISHH